MTRIASVTDGAVGFDQPRWYSPAMQRWIEEDPLFPLSGSNSFEYCDNDPTNLTDPSGLYPHLLIYVDSSNLPAGFNEQGLSDKINATLKAKGVNSNALVIVVKGKGDSNVGALGWDESSKTYSLFVSFTHHDSSLDVATMENGSGDLDINIEGLSKNMAAYTAEGVNSNTVFANSILRELLLHGVLGTSDSPLTGRGPFETGALEGDGGFGDIPQDLLDKINDKLSIPGEEN